MSRPDQPAGPETEALRVDVRAEPPRSTSIFVVAVDCEYKAVT